MHKKPLTLRAARKEIRKLNEALATKEELRRLDRGYFDTKLKELQAKLDDKEDKLLPQKQLLLKELSFLVNATSKAVRTTMWAMVPKQTRIW